VEKIEVVTKGDVRRAKLYYLRGLRGKAAKIRERRDNSPASANSSASTAAEPVAEVVEDVEVDELVDVAEGQAEAADAASDPASDVNTSED